MGGVDRSDQLRSYFTCTRKSSIWWKQLLYFLIDIARVNGYICYIKSRRSPMSHLNFVYAVAEGLIDGYSHGSVLRQNCNARPVGHGNAPIHRLEKLRGPGQDPQICVACRRSGRTCGGRLGKPVRTKFGCRACSAYFCRLSKNPECFASYHGV